MTSDTQEKSTPEPKAEPVKKISAPRPKPTVSGVLTALVVLLLEIVLPALAAGGVLVWLFGYYQFWQKVGRGTALVLFAIAMVVMAFLLAVVLDTLTAPVRTSKRMKGVRFMKDPRTRVVKLALGGILIPLLAFGAVNLAPVPTHGTAMNYLIAVAQPPVRLTPPDEVGAIAQKTDNLSTKLLSIQVLQGFRSPDAMAQLINMSDQDSHALADPSVSDALMKAIAGYGVSARDSLLIDFRRIDPKQAGSSAGTSADIYTRYFAQSFDSLKGEITTNTLDQAAREAQLAQLQAAQAQLKTALTGIQYKPAASGSDPRLDFILQTFLAMDLKQDADVLAFARSTAADARYSSQVRGDALLLVGKLGEAKDLDLLYTYLKTEDNLLLSKALQAISALQTRLAAGGAGS